jgi:hypothetical protein
MTKKTLAWICGAFLAATLAACGGKSKSEGTTPTTPPAAGASDAGPAGGAEPPKSGMLGNPCGGETAVAVAGNPCGK